MVPSRVKVDKIPKSISNRNFLQYRFVLYTFRRSLQENHLTHDCWDLPEISVPLFSMFQLNFQPPHFPWNCRLKLIFTQSIHGTLNLKQQCCIFSYHRRQFELVVSVNLQVSSSTNLIVPMLLNTFLIVTGHFNKLSTVNEIHQFSTRVCSKGTGKSMEQSGKKSTN